MQEIVVIAHNLRSCHNVGSLLRTAEGLGVRRVYLTGYTPYPISKIDLRMPHLATKIAKQINKTALGAEDLVDWEYNPQIEPVIKHLRDNDYSILALEQTAASSPLPELEVPKKAAIIIGREVEGIEPAVISMADKCIEIPMKGKKESFNVVQATAMVLYHCCFVHKMIAPNTK